MQHPAIELDDAERTRCEVWTRVMGYHRPVAAWNPGKQSEYAERRYFVEPSARQGEGQGPRATGPGAGGRGARGEY